MSIVMAHVLLMNTKPLKSSIKFMNYFELCLTIIVLMVCSYWPNLITINTSRIQILYTWSVKLKKKQISQYTNLVTHKVTFINYLIFSTFKFNCIYIIY